MRVINENFLNQFFLLSAPVKNAMPKEQEKQVFFSLAKAYLLDDENANELWEVTQNSAVSQIKEQSDYLRYCRTQQYLREILKMDTNEDKLLAKVIAIKGSALSQATDNRLILENEEVWSKIKANLIGRASEGCVSALTALGIMQINGICVDRDENSGLKNLRKAERWNDIDGAILYLYYSKSDRQECFDRIITSLEMRYETYLASALKEAYPQEAEAYRRNVVACLVEKAFSAGVLNREEFAAPKARILYSKVLSYQDKEVAIYSMDDKQRRSSICDLPLKLDGDVNIEIDEKAFDGMTICRKQEQNRILREAKNFDLRAMSNYSPLCVCADNSVLLQYYVSALSKLVKNANVVFIEVSDLTKKDVDATSNNIFVRKCDEDRANVYIVSFRGEIDPDAMNLALDFLRTSKRRAFGLTMPSVQLDLSCILPICVCDKTNEGMLKKLCNVVNLASVTQDEKRSIIEEMLTRKARLYGIEEISIEKDVETSVAKLSADNIAKALDKAILANRNNAGKLILDEAMLGSILEEFKTINKYGFGGSIQ